MLALSAVVITNNEKDNIIPCIQALQKVVPEIIVVDSFSTDNTVQICEELGAKVVRNKWQGYASQKNYGNSLSSNDWILSIDADEVLSDELIQSILQLSLKDNQVYILDRITSFDGQWIKHSGWYPDWKVRIFNRKNVKWQGDYVHETLDVPKHFKEVRLSGKLYHYSYKNLEDHWHRNKKYARLSAEGLHARGRKATFVKLWLSPPARFFATYFLKGGFLDGRLGYIISKRDAYLVWTRYRILRDLNRE